MNLRAVRILFDKRVGLISYNACIPKFTKWCHPWTSVLQRPYSCCCLPYVTKTRSFRLDILSYLSVKKTNSLRHRILGVSPPLLSAQHCPRRRWLQLWNTGWANTALKGLIESASFNAVNCPLVTYVSIIDSCQPLKAMSTSTAAVSYCLKACPLQSLSTSPSLSPLAHPCNMPSFFRPRLLVCVCYVLFIFLTCCRMFFCDRLNILWFH